MERPLLASFLPPSSGWTAIQPIGLSRRRHELFLFFPFSSASNCAKRGIRPPGTGPRMRATMLSLTTVAALVALLPRASAFGPTSFPLTAPQKISSARCVSLRAPQPAALRAPRQARTGEAQGAAMRGLRTCTCCTRTSTLWPHIDRSHVYTWLCTHRRG